MLKAKKVEFTKSLESFKKGKISKVDIILVGKWIAEPINNYLEF
jgi:hypothetical protein